MPGVKSFLFALPFVLCCYWFLTEVSFFLTDYTQLFALNAGMLPRFALTSVALAAAGLSFSIFVTLAGRWAIIVPVLGIASTTAFITLPLPNSAILALGMLTVSVGIAFLLQRSLQTYLTFNPISLLAPPARRWITSILIVTSVAFWISTNHIVNTAGFTIPDTILDQTLSLLPAPTKSSSIEQPSAKSDSASAEPAETRGMVRQLVKEQINQLLKPYLPWIPLVLALLFFVTLQSLTSLFAMLLPPLLLSLFWAMEKLGFTSYVVETRQVRKLVV